MAERRYWLVRWPNWSLQRTRYPRFHVPSATSAPLNSPLCASMTGACERAKVENKYAEKNIRTLLLCVPVFFSE